jgi:hypothetical protein
MEDLMLRQMYYSYACQSAGIFIATLESRLLSVGRPSEQEEGATCLVTRPEMNALFMSELLLLAASSARAEVPHVQ